jgi:hypothetical protein
MSSNYEGLIFISAANSVITNNNTFTYTFVNSISPRNIEIALVNAYLYYSWPNIAAQFNNQSVSWTFNSSTYTVNFPQGYYSVSDINNFIQLSMFKEGVYLLDSSGNPQYIWSVQTNPVYYANTLTSTVYTSLPSGWSNPHTIPLNQTVQINFLSNNFATLLGFYKSTSYPPAVLSTTYQHNSDVTPEISPTYNVNINVNRVTNNSVLAQNVNTIYQFNPGNSVPYGGQVQLEPQNLLYCPLDSSIYTSITVQFTDQNGVPLLMLDSDVSMCFQTRHKTLRL